MYCQDTQLDISLSDLTDGCNWSVDCDSDEVFSVKCELLSPTVEVSESVNKLESEVDSKIGIQLTGIDFVPHEGVCYFVFSDISGVYPLDSDMTVCRDAAYYGEYPKFKRSIVYNNRIQTSGLHRALYDWGLGISELLLDTQGRTLEIDTVNQSV